MSVFGLILSLLDVTGITPAFFMGCFYVINRDLMRVLEEFFVLLTL